VSVSAQRPVEPLEAEAIWRDFGGRLLGFIARRVPDGDIAEDILQDVMLRIHRHAGELEHAPALSAWVHQIARNAIADHYRRAPVRRERPAGFDLDRDEQALPEPISAELHSELAECLGPLLGQLPAKQREALTLTELEGLTQASAAARLGLSTSGMKSRVQRARAQLKQMLVACCEMTSTAAAISRATKAAAVPATAAPATAAPTRRPCRNADPPAARHDTTSRTRRAASRACVLSRAASSLFVSGHATTA
jgi:RNA polymerase sigma-70 factor (ECF subfamily)